ncbi:hypothetical protein [Methylophaga sp. OBS4]|uniref:hypothetical protein n=1 Tax=Methylophaga sp. OBS4 TaxID=2991935 RepID=UPI002259053E|nr:hypothetical protein [Methylophaga sp. OBS4]MCX4186895.1 hypothetical protein [Methylophaga sp. OBS4]
MNDKRGFEIRVECYAGYRADEEPRRFFFGERAITVSAILDRWIDPSHRYFKLRGDDNAVYILRYDVNYDSWELILYDSGKYAPTRLSST